jgi:hypothetical protein
MKIRTLVLGLLIGMGWYVTLLVRDMLFMANFHLYWILMGTVLPIFMFGMVLTAMFLVLTLEV